MGHMLFPSLIPSAGNGSHIITVPVTANNANVTAVIPAGYTIVSCSLINTTANAVTGGIKIGTTNGGVDVLASLTVGANALTANTTLLKYFFSGSVDTTLFIQTLTSWNSAVVNISFLCQRVIP